MTRIFKTAALVFTVLACLFTASFPVYALDAGLSGNNANGSYMLNNADWTEVTTSYLVPADNGWMAVEDCRTRLPTSCGSCITTAITA